MVTDDYEKALLGAVLRGYKDVPALARIVGEPDFYQPAHGMIWQAINRVHTRGDAVNPLTVKDELGAVANRLPQGPLYLAELDAPVLVQAPFYASKVRDGSVRRQIAELGQRCQQLLTDEDMKPEDMALKIRDWSENIRTHTAGVTASTSAALEEVIDVVEKGEAAATPTPWASLNDLISGWYPGQLIIFGARPGVGKSLALENAATDAARRYKQRVLFVSLEMTKKEIVQRTMAHTAHVPLSKIREGAWAASDPDWHRLNTAAGVIGQDMVTFADKPGQTMAEIRAVAWETKQAALRAGEPFGLIVVDYLQLIRERDARVSRQQQVGEMSRGLKHLARELEVPVVAAAQLNRGPQGRAGGQPVLSDLREAGDIEQDADVVVLMHETTTDDGDRSVPTGDVDLIVAKQRAGAKGIRTVKRFGHYARLVDAA